MERSTEAGDATGFHVAVGDSVTFAKTIGESDVYLFAGITGDLADNHINEQYMRESAYGRRIAHGALLVGFMSTTSTMMIARSVAERVDETPVSLGYDRVRFLGPAYIGDTVKVVYTITKIDPIARRSYSKIEVTNEQGKLIAVAEHILKWVHYAHKLD